MLGRTLVALVLAAALVTGLAGCGDDDSDEGGPVTTATPTSTATAGATAPATDEEAYASALRDAGEALAGLAGSVVSGDAPQDVQESISSGLADWQDAIDRAQAVDLADATLADQRDALVGASPDFVAAWTAVADEWAGSGADGLLELAQQRAPIAAGARALSDAVEGALAAAGDEARSRLEGVRDEISSALEEIPSR